jgi:hypothetical protein
MVRRDCIPFKFLKNMSLVVKFKDFPRLKSPPPYIALDKFGICFSGTGFTCPAFFRAFSAGAEGIFVLPPPAAYGGFEPCGTIHPVPAGG